MGKKYIFFVNEAYCYMIFESLKREIEKSGGEYAWFLAPKLSADHLSGDHLLKTNNEAIDFKPDVVFSAGDWVPYYLPGIKVQVFHGLARNKRGSSSEQSSDHYRIRGFFDLYCTHSETDTKIFNELAGKYGTFLVVKTGWPKLDLLMNKPKKENFSFNNSNKTLFFASTFSPSVTSAPVLLDKIKLLIAEGGWNVIVTLHPKMDPEIIKAYASFESEFYKYVPPEKDLYDAMSFADVMLCDTSSIMYEFMFLQKPVVTFKTRNPGPYLLNFIDENDLRQTLLSALECPELLKHQQAYCKDLHEFNDGQSASRIINAINFLFEDGSFDHVKSKPANILRKIKVRNKMKYWSF
jgi:CDP-glycerol glycerophosphotransferase (TagB/SpsB family)